MKRLCSYLLLFMLIFTASVAVGAESLSLEEMNAAEDALSFSVPAEADETPAPTPEAQEEPATQETETEEAEEADVSALQEEEPAIDPAAREEMINRIIDLAQSLYKKANGKPQRAHYSGDIYICKNFTVHLFREVRSDFCMAEYPDVQLVIPNNKSREDCAPYTYGVEWQDVSAEEGNPFYAAATFRYDDSLTMEENRAKAREFLTQAQRGDYFQMAANYYYGIGAHSMIFIADYDPETDTVRWTDSNMKGKSIDGERYAYVQYDAVREIDWFIDAFCRKKYGATIYRLRDDIIFAQ